MYALATQSLTEKHLKDQGDTDTPREWQEVEEPLNVVEFG